MQQFIQEEIAPWIGWPPGEIVKHVRQQRAQDHVSKAHAMEYIERQRYKEEELHAIVEQRRC